MAWENGKFFLVCGPCCTSWLWVAISKASLKKHLAFCFLVFACVDFGATGHWRISSFDWWHPGIHSKFLPALQGAGSDKGSWCGRHCPLVLIMLLVVVVVVAVVVAVLSLFSCSVYHASCCCCCGGGGGGGSIIVLLFCSGTASQDS